MFFALLACAHSPATLAPPVEAVDSFRLDVHGRSVMGTAIVRTDGDQIRMQAITPAGTSLFSVTVQDGQQQVTSADPELTALLDRLPFYRDLPLTYVYRCEAERCEAGGWRFRATESGWRVKGPGGPMRIETGPPLRLIDGRRGVTTTIVPQQRLDLTDGSTTPPEVE